MQIVASELQMLLDEAAAEGIPGLSAAVATTAGVMWSGTAGYANIETRTLIRPDTLFGIGSITKTLVAVVALQLLEEARLHLQDTVTSILGSAVAGTANADKANLAQLLRSHQRNSQLGGRCQMDSGGPRLIVGCRANLG